MYEEALARVTISYSFLRTVLVALASEIGLILFFFFFPEGDGMLRQGFSVHSSACPGTQRSTGLCHLSTGACIGRNAWFLVLLHLEAFCLGGLESPTEFVKGGHVPGRAELGCPCSFLDTVNRLRN